MTREIYAVILAGGRGERFWPMSTSRKPKQLLALVGDKPLIAAAEQRIVSLIPPERIFIITSADLVEATCGVLAHIPRANIIGEPCARDTAAAVALGAALVKARSPRGAFCVITADHVIGDVQRFLRVLKTAFDKAFATGALLTIGMKPAFPSTGFGYIEAGRQLARAGGVEFFKVRRFVEKPDAATAAAYLKSGSFFWNSGMFVWTVSAFMQALRRFRPQLLDMLRRVEPAIGAPRFKRVLRREYEKLERISIDYAVMEKADNIVMARGDFAWDDVGSWTALENHYPQDARRNAIIGRGECLDSSGNIVVSRDGLVALIGVHNLIIVQAGRSMLVCPKERAQDVKKMVELLRQKKLYHEEL